MKKRRGRKRIVGVLFTILMIGVQGYHILATKVANSNLPERICNFVLRDAILDYDQILGYQDEKVK